MDKLMEEIKEHRGVRDTTINIYKRHLNKLADEITGKDFSSTEFIKQKYGEIKKFLDSQTISKKKNYLAAILAAISPKGKKEPKKGFEKVYDKYVEELLSEHKKYTDKINTHTKNIKEDKNWIDWKDILKLQRKLGREIKSKGYKQSSTDLDSKGRDLLQRYLVLSLYTLHPPRRLEYADTKIISDTDYKNLSSAEKENNIYLVKKSRNKKYFSFGKEAVKSETKDNVIIPVDRGLNSVLNLWLSYNDSDNLLLNSRGQKLSHNGLTKFLNKIFKHTGKKISANMLRKIKISNEFEPEEVEKKQKLAEAMNHSVGVQQSVYLKKD